MNGCVYKQADGTCEKYTDDVVHSFCVDGPCEDCTPSNADHIRAMSDEELMAFLILRTPEFMIRTNGLYNCPPHRVCSKRCRGCWLKWLKEPYPAKD